MNPFLSLSFCIARLGSSKRPVETIISHKAFQNINHQVVGLAIERFVKFEASNSIARCDQPDVAKSTETVGIDEALIFSRRIVSDTEKIRFTRSRETITLMPSTLPRVVVSDTTAYFTDFCRETDDKHVVLVQKPNRLVVDLAAHT